MKPGCRRYYLPFLSKLLEMVVSAGIFDHLIVNNLQGSHQSIYRKHYYTDCSVKDRHSGDTRQWGISGIHNVTSISCIWKSWSLSRSKGIISETLSVDSLSSEDVTLLYRMPQGSVFIPKAYSMYTLPLGLVSERHHMQCVTLRATP